MKLIIVESPTKARTLSRFLGKEFVVEATMGHIRDLPKAALGVDVAGDFTPDYVIPRDKKKRVGELKKIAAKAEHVILATDPDREGEAIAWHVATILETSSKKKETKTKKKIFDRIVFHEITETAIREALANPRTIDEKLVDAQQARRVLDRLVGYKLSPLLWQKLSRRWLSAGRVQSVAVRLIVEREREIARFTKDEYWTIEATFTSEKGNIVALLVAKNGEKYERTLSLDLFDGKYTVTKTTIPTEGDAKRLIADFTTPYVVRAVDRKEVKRYPGAPFITSTLQQEASRKLYFSSKKTMQLAQKLYEEGLISYHRTDSVNLAEKFISEARDYIRRTYGATYIPEEPRKFQTKSKVAQEAHEAIRPTDVNVHGADISSRAELNRDHTRLYELIWKRALACQAKEAIFDSTTIVVTSDNGYEFEAKGSVVKFDGFLAIMGRDVDEVDLPVVTVGAQVALKKALPTKHETNPPPRYTEASLVKTLEEKDIGRPSTYAPTMSTIEERHYVEKEDKKLKPTDLGDSVTDFLVTYFPQILDLPFTAQMEGNLDRVASGEIAWVPLIREFYEPFAVTLEETYQTAQKVKMEEVETGDPCPKCGSALVIRMGRYGRFIACTTFPKCDYTKQYVETIDKNCPRCGSPIVVKKSRRGKMFYGCSKYPECTFAAWKKEDIK